MKKFEKPEKDTDEEMDDVAAGSNPDADLPRRTLKPAARAVLAVGVLLIGIILGTLLILTKRKPEKKPPPRVIPRVQVMPFSTTSEQVTVEAMGTVIPAREIMLKPRVSGEVIRVHREFIPGGRVQAGDILLKIDPTDYRLALAQAKSRLAQAEYDYKLELGRQDVARREWEVMGEPEVANDTDRELALRKPHLKFFKASLEAARANLEQAEINLRRTEITAPFNAVVQQRMVELGSQVSPQDGLARLVAADEYWVQVSLPVDRLEWIRFPGSEKAEGSMVTVRHEGGQREGRVIRLLSDLEETGRMARALVSVKQPLQGVPPLLLGSYVRAEIAGRKLEDVIRLPRTALRDADHIWILTNQNRLDIRTVEPLWRGRTHVLIRNGFQPADRLVVSPIPVPIQDMELEPVDRQPADNEESRAS